MKQLLIRLEDDTHELLDKLPNKSEFVRQAINEKLMGPSELEISPHLTEQRVRGIIKEELQSIDLFSTVDISSPVKPVSEFVPKPPDPEKGYPCCSGKSPCKHWVWDSNEVVYINTITGKRREVE